MPRSSFTAITVCRPPSIENVVVRVPEPTVDVVCEPVANKKRPQNSYDAQFSIPYIVATGLLKGRFTLDDLDDASLADPLCSRSRSASVTKSTPSPPFRVTTRAKWSIYTTRRPAPRASRGGQPRLAGPAAQQRRHRRQIL